MVVRIMVRRPWLRHLSSECIATALNRQSPRSSGFRPFLSDVFGVSVDLIDKENLMRGYLALLFPFLALFCKSTNIKIFADHFSV